MIDIKNTYADPLLSRLAVKYANRPMVASQIFPWVRVPKDTFLYPKFDRGVTFKRAQTKYGPRSAPNELELKVTKVAASLTPRGLGARIDDDERKLSDIGEIRVFKTQTIMDAMFLDLELEVATAMTTAASYAAANKTTLVGTAQWSDPAADPKKDVLTAHAAMVRDGNTMVVSKKVHNAIIQNPKVLDAVKYVDGAVSIPTDKLARYFEVERYIVVGAQYDTAADGQTESLSDVWGKFAWVGYVEYKNPTALAMQNKASFGCLPISTEAGSPFRVFAVPPDPRTGSGEGQEFVKVDAKYDPLYQCYDLGYLISAAIA